MKGLFLPTKAGEASQREIRPFPAMNNGAGGGAHSLERLKIWLKIWLNEVESGRNPVERVEYFSTRVENEGVRAELMTIKEFAAQMSVSDKAIYKRLKREGIELSSLKIKGSSALSPEGEARLRELYPLQAPESIEAEPENQAEQENPGEPGAVENPVESPVENSTNQVESPVENSTIEVERLKAEIRRLEELNKQLIDERDFLRGSLERAQVSLDQAQQLQAMTTAKIPTPKALPAGGDERGVRTWFRRHFPAKGGGEDDRTGGS